MGQKSNNGITFDDLLSTESIDMHKELYNIRHEAAEHNDIDSVAKIFLFAYDRMLEEHGIS